MNLIVYSAQTICVDSAGLGAKENGYGDPRRVVGQMLMKMSSPGPDTLAISILGSHVNQWQGVVTLREVRFLMRIITKWLHRHSYRQGLYHTFPICLATEIPNLNPVANVSISTWIFLGQINVDVTQPLNAGTSRI